MLNLEFKLGFNDFNLGFNSKLGLKFYFNFRPQNWKIKPWNQG